MTTSNSVDFSVTRDNIIQDALENLGVLAEGGTASSDQTTQMSRKLNMIVKQWQGSSDFAPGLKMWSRKRGYVFLQTGQSSFSLGPSGDKAASSYVTTTTTAAAVLGAGSLTVSSIVGISASDNIGIELSTGALQWTTVSGAPSGATVTLAAVLTASVASGARIFTYTPDNQIRRPLTVNSAVLRSTSGIDIALNEIITVEDYEAIPNKSADGTPTAYFYEPQLTNGVLYLDREPSDVTRVVRLVYLSSIEDFDAASDTPDYPQEWYRPLCWQLTIDGAASYGVQVTPDMKINRDEALAIARNANPENSSLSFQCDE